MSPKGGGAAAAAVVVGVVVAGCGNFFPNPDNVVLPSAARSYDLVCRAVPRGECEARAEKLVAQKRQDQPGNRVVTVRLDADGGYTIEFADGSAENLIAN